ncbi:OLC1v1027130C1 [Oldenlandia corymbosa var. corymbosa]|uniref:OLC1v1027130C1 n=1 Tax=Oldenlandia corymbosa var. corymbosa TaxID=529605 RepID=A0AAV1C9G7_OLDCO|nr:OLC1v1027130C1 [Oldenlandia corymbosa var. corymbosa]
MMYKCMRTLESSYLVHKPEKMTKALRYWKSSPLLLICLLALTIRVSDAQDQSVLTPGFISIDCGLPLETGNYSQAGITYITDESFIDTGISINVAREYMVDSDSQPRNLWNVRSFPNGTRNCYNLEWVQGKGKKYLIRASFLYGNYDGKDQAPRFELHLGYKLWDNVNLTDSISTVFKEIIHVPSSNYLFVCLVNAGDGTPFISALELRLLNDSMYPRADTGNSLASGGRWNLAATDPNKALRFPDDIYDRRWEPYFLAEKYAALNTTSAIRNTSIYAPPMAAMQTAMMPLNVNQPVLFDWTPLDPNVPYYFFLHFAEVQPLQGTDYRAFYINLSDQRWIEEAVVPAYLSVTTKTLNISDNKSKFNYSLVKTENSTLRPIINALEVYSAVRFLQSQTEENDVGAILNVKSAYNLVRDWQGDPCLPKPLMWDGLDCFYSDDTSVSPRIKSLNLSFSGLTGSLSSDFSKLTSLDNLDLSNNSLNGPIPEFLAELPQLKFLNLSGNQFSGSVPQKLLDKAKNGLQLRADGYETCKADQCKGEESKKFVVPLVASLIASLVVLAALIVTLRLRSRIPFTKIGANTNRKDGLSPFLEPKNLQFNYSDILKMTDNFQRVLGKGGFGTVYHGLTPDGKQVAVKLLSLSSAQGYNEFQTEAEILARVHHRNLTCLIGYCYEDSHMALVYEYMARGNLREHLSATDDNVLSWSQRVQIALDAAQGLDYLHSGCKPPIIHRDVKSSNILLNQNLETKLADFGLSRAFTVDDGSHVSTRVVGTPGYLDPEYYETQRLNEKSDAYSFGIVLLELITGRPAISGTDEKRHIMQWVSHFVAAGDIAGIVDPKLKGIYDTNSAWKALEVALACASPTSLKRPTMADVITELKECLVAQKLNIESETTDESALLEVNPEILESEVGPR